jgi:hypothetical protein
MATAAKLPMLDETGASLARAYRQDVALEAVAYRAFAQAEHNLTLAQQRRRVSESAYRLHSGAVLA